MKKKIYVNNLIFEKIKFRYHFMNLSRVRSRQNMGKILLDTFFPTSVGLSIHSKRTTIADHGTNSKQGYCISELVSKEMNARKLHISELTTMLGYTKTQISKLLQNVKNKQLNIILVGLGGTGSNFLHWMYEMSEWTGKTDIFQTIIGKDDDSYDVPNMLRIPFIPNFKVGTDQPKKAFCIPTKFKSLTQNYIMYDTNLNPATVEEDFRGHPASNTFIYGAPDIETRRGLSECPYTFFAATHRDNEYSIVINPSVDNELMMETYGKINLSMFFLNHLSMTIDFLEYLVQRETSFTTQVQNEEIVRQNFTEKFEEKMQNGFKCGNKKVFAIQHSDRNDMQIDLPEEA